MNYGKIILEKDSFVAVEQKDEATFIIRAIVHELEDGKVDCVETTIFHEPTDADHQALIAAYLDDCKGYILSAITEYDTSDEVNGFELNGVTAWLDKATRVGLVNLLDSQKNAGQTETTLWLNGHSMVLGVDAALSMMRELEIYAGQCYNQTEAHKAAEAALTSIDDVEHYDYKANYPERPSFTV